MNSTVYVGFAGIVILVESQLTFSGKEENLVAAASRWL